MPSRPLTPATHSGLGLVGGGGGVLGGLGSLPFPHPERVTRQGPVSGQFSTALFRLTSGGRSLGNPRTPQRQLHGWLPRPKKGRLEQQMAGKPSGAAPPHPGQGTNVGTDYSGTPGPPSESETSPCTPPPPPARFRGSSQLEWQSVSRQGRGRAGAHLGVRRGVARPASQPSSGDSAAPALSLGGESPQVASGRGVTAVTRPPLRENAVSRALHQPRGQGAPAAEASPAQRPRLRPAGKPREPERGWRSHVSGRPVPPPPPARRDPANPGRSRVTLKPPSCPTGASRG